MNMHIERMHRTLKDIYLQGKKMMHLDKSLYTLMKFIRDHSIDRLIVIRKGEITSKTIELCRLDHHCYYFIVIINYYIIIT